MKTPRVLGVLILTVTLGGVGSPLFGSALYSIGVLNPDSPYSEVRAVSHDGTYVVGTSRSAGQYTGGSPWPAPAGTNAPVIWSLATGLVELPCPSGRHSLAHGVAIGISNNLGNIIISGLHEGDLTLRFYKAPLTNLAEGTWTDVALAGGLGSAGNVRQGTANDLRTHPGHDGRWYTAGRRHDTGRNARYRGDPTSGWDGAWVRTVASVSAYGVNVGRGNENPSCAWYEGPGAVNPYFAIPGSEGYRADGFGISSSFGKSATNDFDVQWICGQVFNYEGTNPQAFRWKRGDASMTFLGALPGAISSVAYTIADNGVTAGRSYFGAYEEATVWDTSGTWDTTGEPKSLKALLEADGVDTSAWTSLARVYATSDDGRVLAGFGTWEADGSTRGFVAVKTGVVGPVVRITHLSVVGTTVTLHFTSSNLADTTESFAVQSCAVVNGTYENVSAIITGANGSFQASVDLSGPTQFYRIRRL